MKKVIFILFMIIVFSKSYGQEEVKQKVNFVIMVDDKIPDNMKLQFGIEKENQKSDTISIDYIPGDIVLKDSDFNKIESKEVKSVNLNIHYSKLCKTNINYYTYKIKFYPAWLHYPFTVLRIYNLDSKKNQKIFFPLEGQKYTYEMDSPNGSMIRVRKKHYKVNCN